MRTSVEEIPSVDVHTHLAPLLTPATAADLGVESADGAIVVDGHAVGPAALYRPAALEGFLDECRVTQALVSIPPPLFRQGLAGPAAARWAQAVNDGLVARLEGRDRLRPLAYLPLDQPAAAIAEYRRVRAMDHFAGVAVAAGGGTGPLDDPELTTLWADLDTDGRGVFLHPAAAPDRRLDRFYLANLLGNPSETALAAADLVFSGMLARFPGIRFVLAHCGGTLPAVVGRWQRGLDTARPGIGELALGPAAAVRRLYVDSLSHDPRVVDLAAEVFGTDRLLLGSDWPFPMGTSDVRGTVRHRGPEAENLIACRNPGRAFPVRALAARGER